MSAATHGPDREHHLPLPDLGDQRGRHRAKAQTSVHDAARSALLQGNGSLAPSEPAAIISWGTITLANLTGGSPGSFVTCHSADAGTLQNPEGGGAGEGSTQGFATFDLRIGRNLPCRSVKRPRGRTAVARRPHRRKTRHEIRQATTGVKLSVECRAGGTVESRSNFITGAAEKGLRPSAHRGTSALHPSFFEFGAALDRQLDARRFLPDRAEFFFCEDVVPRQFFGHEGA